MFWFDKSRKELVSYARNLSFTKRIEFTNSFQEIVKYTLGTDAPKLNFNKTDAKLIDGFEIPFVKALYRTVDNKAECLNELNTRLRKDKLRFDENNEIIVNERGACAYIMLIDTQEGYKIRKIQREGEPKGRLLREFNIIKSLNQVEEEIAKKYIVKVIEVSSNEYIMDYADDSLEQYIMRPQTHLSFDEMITWILRIVDCVYFLHSHEILHRDLHPGNWLFIDKELRVSDFGLACYFTDDRTGKGYKPSYGMPEYTANEQIESLENTSVKSDIYTVGKLINFIFTKSPNKNNHPLHVISEKCTRSNPEERYSSILEIKADIANFLSSHNVVA